MTGPTSAPGPARKRGNKVVDGFVSCNPETALAIRRYLEALQSAGEGRAPSRTAETVQRELQHIRWQIVMADPSERAMLAQQRVDLEAELETFSRIDSAEFADLEEGFIACAARYSARNGITYAAWRAIGIEPEVLRRAGIARGE